MGSKGAFNSRKVLNEIEKMSKAFPGKTIVIYCIDTDQMDREYSDNQLFEEIKAFCKSNQYELIWFFRDVEDVYLGRQVNGTTYR